MPIILILFVVLILQNVKFFNSAKPIYQYSGTLIIGIGAIFWATILQYNLDLSRVYSIIKANQIEILSFSDPADAINYFDDSGSLVMIAVNFFIALFSGIFRPLIPDFSSFAQILSSLENLVIFGLFIVGLRRHVVPDKSVKILLAALILYVIILATLLSYSSPNFGTLARYKVYFMPFFVLAILIKNPLVEWFEGRYSNSSS